MYEISVDHAFRARHSIRLPDGSWEPAHSHLWCVTATFRASELDETMGVVLDFLSVQDALKKSDHELDGAELNELPVFEGLSPSAERVAEYIAEHLLGQLGADCGLYRVTITEAPGCAAAFYPESGERG